MSGIPLHTETNLGGTLAAGIGVSDTSISVNFVDRITGLQRTPLATTLIFVIDKGTPDSPNPNYEIVLATSHSTTNGVTTLAGVTRGLAFSGDTLGATGTPQAHVYGAEIGCVFVHHMTDQLAGLLDGSLAFGNNLNMGNNTLMNVATPISSNLDHAANVSYVNSVALVSAPNGSPTVKGVFQEATAAQTIAGTQAGSTGADLVVNPAALINTSVSVTTSAGVADSGKFVRTDPSGKVSSTFLEGNPYTDVPYTANEAISLGGMASMTATNDYVENLVISNITTEGTSATFSAQGDISDIQACYAAPNTVAVIFRSSTGSLGYVVVGTVNTSNKTITWGTPVSLGFDVGSTSMAYMADNKLVLGYRNVATSKLCIQIASVSGTVPTLGASGVVSDQNASAQGYCAVACIDTDKVVCAFRYTGSSRGYIQCFTVSGTSFSGNGTDIEILQTGAGHAISNLAAAKVDTDKCVVFCRDEGDSNKGKGALIIASGTALTAATEVVYDANTVTSNSAAYLTDGSIILCYSGGASARPQAIVAGVSGTSLSFGTPLEVSTDSAISYVSVAAINATTAYLAYEKVTGTLGELYPLTIASTNVTAGAVQAFNGGSTLSYVSIAKVNGNNKFMVLYEDTADSNKGNSSVFQVYNNSVSLVGFATSAVSAGASVSVRSKGLITGQSGLVAGTTYYVTSTGAVGTSNDNGVKVGIGADATSLDINIDNFLPITITQANTLIGGSTSDASALHTHTTIGGARQKVVTTGATDNFNHGLGETPNWIKINATAVDNGSNAYVAGSFGQKIGSTYGCSSWYLQVGTGAGSGYSTTSIIDIVIGGISFTATVVLTSTQVQITWAGTVYSYQPVVTYTWEVGV